MIESRLPASSEQVEVWLAHQREPESGRFNIPLDLEFLPSVEVGALRAALRDLTARHLALRTSFEIDNGELTRLVHKDVTVPLVERDRRQPYDSASALKWAEQAAMRPFDTTSAPLLRGELLRHPDGALLVLTVHHLISDGWSQQLIVRDLMAFYRARLAGELPPPAANEDLPELPADTGTDEETLDRYWDTLLADDVPSLAPIVDFNRDNGSPGTPAWVETELGDEVLTGVRELARKELASPALIVLSAWLTLLHAWSAVEDGTSGMLFAARVGDTTDEEVDLRARVLPLRSQVGAGLTFRELLARMRDQVADSLEHSVIPSERLRSIRAAHGTGTLVDPCLFMHFPDAEGEWEAGSSRVRIVEHDGAFAKNDMSLSALEGRSRLRLRIDYDSTVYRRATAALFLDQLTEVLTQAVADAGRTCEQLVVGCDHFTPQDRSPRYAPAKQVLLHELVRQHAAARPEAIAVRHGAEAVTYGELVARASAIAHWLRAQGVTEQDKVALLLPPGVTSVVCWLATLFAGAAYLPLDSVYPDAQLQLVLDDARPRLLVGDAELLKRVKPTSCAAFSVEQMLYGALGSPVEPPQVSVTSDSPLTVLYTSGSTGRPKGVVLPHSGIARLHNRPDFIPVDESDVFSQLGPLNFDLATYEVWAALAHGAQLVVFEKAIVLNPRELRDAFRSYGVTRFTASTPLMNRLIEDVPDVFQPLRGVICGGENISVPHIRRVLRWSEPGTILHCYGPTENSFISTWLPITQVEEGARTIPIGSVVPDTEAYVVTDIETMDPAPRGVPGELLLGGVGLAHGYLSNREETERRFLPNPFSRQPGSRVYRTGDRARWTPEGLLEFIGRVDNQVKIRGQRIELGEVESALAAHPAVEAAFVTTAVNARNEKEIAAYVVLNGTDTAQEIRTHLRGVLPQFAIPRYLIELPHLPLAPNGKVDRRRLPAPSPEAEATAQTVTAGETAPVTAEAQKRVPPVRETSGQTTLPVSRLAAPVRPTMDKSVMDGVRAAWARVLEHDRFGPDDNFFDVGGHSLILVRLTEAIKELVGRAPTIRDLLRHTSIRAQVALLGGSADASVVGTASATEATEVADTTKVADTTEVGEATRATAPTGLRVVAVSARSAAALEESRLRLARHIDTTPALTLDDLAVTLDRGRERFDHRFAVATDSLAAAAGALRGENAEGVLLAAGQVDPRTARRVVLAFGGHDDARAATEAWYAASSTVRQWVDAADRILGDRAGASLAGHLTGGARSALRDVLGAFVVQYGLSEHLAERGLFPDLVLGRGVGHLVAAVTAGALEFADALRLAEAFAAEVTSTPSGRPDGGWANTAASVSFHQPRIPLLDPLSGRAAPDAGALEKAVWHEPDPRELLLGAADGQDCLVVDVDAGEWLGTAAAELDHVVSVPLLGAEQDAERLLPTALARLWCAGIDLELTVGTAGRRTRLPGHPLERKGMGDA